MSPLPGVYLNYKGEKIQKQYDEFMISYTKKGLRRCSGSREGSVTGGECEKSVLIKKPPGVTDGFFISGVPTRIRTAVTGVKGLKIAYSTCFLSRLKPFLNIKSRLKSRQVLEQISPCILSEVDSIKIGYKTPWDAGVKRGG
jgi:hypothetical protein